MFAFGENTLPSSTPQRKRAGGFALTGATLGNSANGLRCARLVFEAERSNVALGRFGPRATPRFDSVDDFRTGSTRGTSRSLPVAPWASQRDLLTLPWRSSLLRTTQPPTSPPGRTRTHWFVQPKTHCRCASLPLVRLFSAVPKARCTLPVSCSGGRGINGLWRELLRPCANDAVRGWSLETSE